MILNQSFFPEAVEIVFPEDQVVDHLDAEDLSGFDEFPGDLQIILGGLGVAGGVVVSQNDGGCAVKEGLLENFAGVNQAGREDANRNG